jgi:flavin reductase (DIM6/NTAB) family NADH-FMN oxidoreductase RutF
VTERLGGGDHVIVVGRIIEAGIGRDVEPFTFFEGGIA